MRLPLDWLAELVDVPADVTLVARTLGLRGFEVASIETSPHAVIDFEVTANRPDCLSIAGLAREASAAFGSPFRPPDTTPRPGGPAAEALDVTIEDAERCPRYCAQLFEVTGGGSTPAWMQRRLEAAGVRSISPVVDVTNYVMLEIGQPTHGFDYARLQGGALRIRQARAGEKVRTLDGVERPLEAGMLVIADRDRPQAVAGVMGGADSEIGAGTRLMVLESAYFQPASVRRTSKRLALKTEASSRFERGGDVEAAPAAIARAAALFHQLGVARPVGPLIDRYPSPRSPLTLTLRASRIERVLGMAVDPDLVPRILEPLGFQVSRVAPDPLAEGRPEGLRYESQRPAGARRTSDNGLGIPDDGHRTSDDGSQWSVTVPSFRVDVQREIDLVEEIARHDGYAALPASFPTLTVAQAPPDARTLRDRTVRHVLTACGLSEAMTFAFIERAAALPFGGEVEPAALANPLSEKYAVLRPSLLPGLVDAAAHNRRRERKDIRLFEVGARFGASGERRGVAGIWAGAASTAHWSDKGRVVDVFDIKGVVEALARALDVDLVFAPASHPYFSVASAFRRKSDLPPEGGSHTEAPVIGELGQLAPAILQARGLPANEPMFAFEIDLDAVAAQAASGELRVSSLPRFPSIVRDLSILVDDSLPAGRVRGTIRSAAPATLIEVIEFDRYRGRGVPEGRVSLSLRLTFRSPDRTLTDAEADEAMSGIVTALTSAHDAVRR